VVIDRQEPGNKRLFYKLFYKVFVVIMLLFSIWRLGFIVQLAEGISLETVAEFLVNIMYIVFGAMLLVTFYRKIPWLKKAIIILLWTMFLVITFIIGPATGESELTDSTLFQTLVMATLFVVPNSMIQYRKMKNSGGI